MSGNSHLLEQIENQIKIYLKDNLTIEVEISPPGFYETLTRVEVKVKLNGELISSNYDTLRIPE